MTDTPDQGWAHQELPGMPAPTETPFDKAVSVTRTTLTNVRERIELLVQQRLEINEEIKTLREWDDRLDRMLKLADKK